MDFSTKTNRTLIGPAWSGKSKSLALKPKKETLVQTSNQRYPGKKNQTYRNSPQNPLNIAVLEGNMETILRLLKSGADPKEKDGLFGNNSMHWAVIAKNIKVMELFKERGLLFEKNNFDWTPLHLAAAGSCSETLVWLLDNGAEVDTKDKLKQTPLFTAVFKGNIVMAQLLFERGADLKTTDGWEKSLLHTANKTNVLEWLIDHGLDVNVRDDWGRTPLHDSALSSNTNKLILLLRNGASIDAKDRNGCTPLYEAAKRGNIEFVRLLLNKGADPECIANDGSTPATVTKDENIKYLLNQKCLGRSGKKVTRV